MPRLSNRGVQRGRLVVGVAWMPEDGEGWRGMNPRRSARPWRGYVPWRQPSGRHAAPRHQLRADTPVVQVRLNDILEPDRDRAMGR